jgi:hypothetical protein
MTGNDDSKVAVVLTKKQWEAVAEIVVTACQLRTNDWRTWGERISKHIISQVSVSAQQVINGMEEGDLTINVNTVLNGMVAGNVFLRSGHLQVGGMIVKQLIIVGDASVFISGMIQGYIVNKAGIPRSKIQVSDQLVIESMGSDSNTFRIVAKNQKSHQSASDDYDDYDPYDDGLDGLRDAGYSDDDIWDFLGD